MKVHIIVSLVREAEKKSREQLVEQIWRELSIRPVKIPWMKEVLYVTVKD